jgi:hypothetical protein
MYRDDRNRGSAAVQLNEEAFKAFSDTIVVKRRHELAAESMAWKAYSTRSGMASGERLPLGPATNALIEYVNYENLKIACGFELHLKARLVACDILVHEVDDRSQAYKALAKEQKKRPVTTAELFVIDSYRFDGQVNYLPGLKDTSVKFSLLTKAHDYRQALNLPAQDIDYIDYYRCLRNQIHLPNEWTDVPNVRFPETAGDFIVRFINTRIIPLSNSLIAKNNLPRAPHCPLS